MIVDAHQHFWRLDRGDYTWLTPQLGVLYRDYLPNDLAPLHARLGIGASVLVQAAASEAETHYLLALARRHESIAGVVGWTDFATSDAPQHIAALVGAGGGKLKGLRPMIQDIADPGWIGDARLDAAFVAMVEHDLAFDALVKPMHLSRLRERLSRHPQLRAVVDHAGKPVIAAGEFDAWAREIERLANTTGAYCKLSGLLTEAAPGTPAETFAPWVEHVFACFGPGRVIWGSDWPVLNLVGDYAGWFELAREWTSRHAPGGEHAVFGDNALRFYQLWA
ncbi:MAG: amidohydrolase family protein [Proteobacteria bacterium]|nr:amidohydrolase family protein [Pseudomonadota bacterium]